uniref:Uncharacterized protein n=1 Tax=Scophthalmus maximus TaxID=52904 RepID=A0A8D3D9U8_SCOMX
MNPAHIWATCFVYLLATARIWPIYIVLVRSNTNGSHLVQSFSSNTPFVLLAFRLGGSQSEDICRTNDDEVEVWGDLRFTLSARLGGKKKICSTEAVIPRLLIPGSRL